MGEPATSAPTSAPPPSTGITAPRPGAMLFLTRKPVGLKLSLSEGKVAGSEAAHRDDAAQEVLPHRPPHLYYTRSRPLAGFRRLSLWRVCVVRIKDWKGPTHEAIPHRLRGGTGPPPDDG